ncbi:hypothetical protein H5410_055926 [Solanum commersonii]|uniref:adenylate kinase n=1 Tax=Solanum commersonii TaxID=4109 RepID=A0A9J5WL87_SOLCO|nr:hypothetical protein H5410_055926 [Solanum commersonii]
MDSSVMFEPFEIEVLQIGSSPIWLAKCIGGEKDNAPDEAECLQQVHNYQYQAGLWSSGKSMGHDMWIRRTARLQILPQINVWHLSREGEIVSIHFWSCVQYGLVHIAAGDLLRAEIAAGSENGKQAKEYMDKGKLVPNEIIVTMVKERLNGSDSREKGWLLDGYPRSSSQAIALKEFGFQPDLFILLEVPEEILVERVVGRRLDPVTGKIYHLKYSPPETEEIATRVTQRFDDTEEKACIVKLRLQTHHQNVEAVLSMYEDIIVKVNGSGSKQEVFTQIDGALTQLLEQKQEKLGTVAA